MNPGNRPPATSTESTADASTCSNCGCLIDRADTLILERITVCASCRDVVLQRLMAGEEFGAHEPKRRGKRLVFPPGTDLGDRCLACGGPTRGVRVTKIFRWHHPALWIAAIVPPVFQVLLLLSQKKVEVEMPLCPRHAMRRYRLHFGAWLSIVLGGGGLFFAEAARQHGLETAMAFLVLSGAMTLVVLSTKPIRVKWIDRNRIEMAGASEAYLRPLADVRDA